MIFSINKKCVIRVEEILPTTDRLLPHTAVAGASDLRCRRRLCTLSGARKSSPRQQATAPKTTTARSSPSPPPRPLPRLHRALVVVVVVLLSPLPSPPARLLPALLLLPPAWLGIEPPMASGGPSPTCGVRPRRAWYWETRGVTWAELKKKEGTQNEKWNLTRQQSRNKRMTNPALNAWCKNEQQRSSRRRPSEKF